MKYTCRPPVIGYTPAAKVKHCADRKAHDALFFAVKSFFDGLTDAQRAALNTTPDAVQALAVAFEVAEERASK